ncbi:MAG: PorV/PorQ family protein [Elusimicrobia bacterium]|nr:PorV/PorQ family protein [Elusimicrobiota bacterium]
MRLRTLALSACLWLAAAGRAALAQSAGGEAFNFLSLDANARAAALGGAYTALASDANAMLYNPAGLGRVRRHEATFMHHQYVEDMSQEYVSLATRYGVGAQINYLRWGSLGRTTYSRADGTLGSFTINDLAVAAGYGMSVGDALSLGATGKYIMESNDNVTASGWAGDLGAMLSLPEVPWLTLGLAVQKLGPDITFYQRAEKLPLTVRFGAAAKFSDLTVAADFSKNRFDEPRAAAGVEKIVFKAMAVRLGFTSRNDADIGISGGAGWAWQDLSVDYAFVPYGDMGVAHRVSVSWRWDRWGVSAADGGRPTALSSQEKRRRFLGQAESVQPRRAEGAAAAPAASAPEFHLERARRALELPDLAGAKAELAVVADRLGPEDRRRTAYWVLMGDAAYAAADVSQAKAHYSEALKLAGSLGIEDSAVASAYVGMGNCLARDNGLEEALKFYRKAFQLNPAFSTRQLIDAAQKKLGPR